MNANTKKDFQDFVSAVEQLACAVSSVAGTDSVGEILETAERLKAQLEKDETILH